MAFTIKTNVSDGQTSVPLDQTLSWEKVGSGSLYGYRVRFGTSDYKFDNPLIYNDTFDTSYDPGGLNYNTTYYLFIDVQVDYSPDVWQNYVSISFTTICQPESFNLSSPSNGASNVSLRPTFQWSSSSYATSYDLYINNALFVTNIVGTSFTALSDFDWEQTISWKVLANNQYGSKWSSQTYSFTTLAQPLPPNIADCISPANDTDLTSPVSRTSTLNWQDGDGSGDPATSYDVYLGVDQSSVASADNADSTGIFRGNQTSTSYNPGSLGPDTVYYWRIDARNDQGVVQGSVWMFCTIDVPEGVPVNKKYKKRLVALADNQFWYEDDDGVLQTLSGLTVDTTQKICMTSAYQKVFVVNGSSKSVVDFSNTAITISDSSFSICKRGTILKQASGGGRMSVDYFDKTNKTLWGFVYAGSFDTGSVDWTDEDGVAKTYNISLVNSPSVSSPGLYDWEVYPDDEDQDDMPVNGNMPPEPTIVALYRGRLVLSGDSNSPHIDYMSEYGNPFNFSYVGDSEVSAVASSGGYSGQIGDAQTAIIPYKNDYMLVGSQRSIWLQRGDPASGGSRDQVSKTCGIFSQDSWCWGSSNDLYFLDTNGIYRLTMSSFEVESVTADKLPYFHEEFALDENLHCAVLTFDNQNMGIHISKVYVDTGENQNFWFDLRTGGLFPEEYPSECGIYSSHYYDAQTPSMRKLFLGCKDGYIRCFDFDSNTDQCTSTHEAITSEAVIASVEMSKDGLSNSILNLFEVVQAMDGDVDYEIFSGKSAKEVFNKIESNSPSKTGTISGLRSKTIRPRLPGEFFAIRLSNNRYNSTWAIEKIALELQQKGKLR